MKTIAAATMAALIGLAPLTAGAQTQGGPPAPFEAGQQVAQKQPGSKQQPRKRQWKKGGKYGGKGTQVSNFRRHNLKAPPRGHRWVRDGNDFLLIAIGTGVIASIVHGR